MIKVRKLTGGYSAVPVIKELDLEIQKGEFFALLGPNGSGKTTLFKLITGQLPIQQGEILIDEKPITAFSKLEKAKKVAVLTQEVQVSFDYTVEEIISLGRYPHQSGIFKSLSKEDKKVMEYVMRKTKITTFRDTQFRKLSGGEKQRVLLAKALVQEPEILLLDEPTNHLDIKHSFQMLDLIKEWQQTKGLTVFSILHDLNVASLYADRLALLYEGAFLEVGDTDTLRKEEQLKKVYEVEIQTQSHPIVPKPQLLMTPSFEQPNHPYSLREAYQMEQTTEYIHVQFNQPMRSISNGVVGDGIQWLKHFCNFHVSKNYNCSNPKKDLHDWMGKYHIPAEQAVGLMTAVQLEDVRIVMEKIDGIEFIAVVTAGVGNAVDISKGHPPNLPLQIGTINTMVFIDAHFTDGALVNGLLSATEAKVKAMQDLEIMDPETKTLATGTSTDAMVLAVTQQGVQTPYAGSGTVVGRGIGHVVYQATTQAIRKYLKRVQG
ncbi:MAG: adenosylcobinamide amidohydrolase [Bacillota bacterium]